MFTVKATVEKNVKRVDSRNRFRPFSFLVVVKKCGYLRYFLLSRNKPAK
jgi:hypothetical protein